VEYSIDFAGGARLTPRLDYAYRSHYFFTEFNTPDARQNGYGKLDVAISFEPGRGNWKLYGYVRNVTDENVIGSMAIVSPLLGSVRVVNLIPPRNFGVGASLKF
jgi:iron complex outermembrane receptor protein